MDSLGDGGIRLVDEAFGRSLGDITVKSFGRGFNISSTTLATGWRTSWYGSNAARYNRRGANFNRSLGGGPPVGDEGAVSIAC